MSTCAYDEDHFGLWPHLAKISRAFHRSLGFVVFYEMSWACSMDPDAWVLADPI